jgi:hypothetical protein
MLTAEERSILTAVLEETLHTAAALTSHADEASKVRSNSNEISTDTDVLPHLAQALVELRIARILIETMLEE